MNGFRQCLEKEFNSIYLFNLRGNQRTIGELSRKEGGKIFGSGSRAPVAITLLVKKPKKNNQKVTIFYRDIGDYLSRDEKLSIVKKLGSAQDPEMNWKILTPNNASDWINQRNAAFDMNIPIAPEKKFDSKSKSFFTTYSLGANTSRDVWAYNSSINKLAENMTLTINFYNEQVTLCQNLLKKSHSLDFNQIKGNNPRKIKWASGSEYNVLRGNKATFSKSNIVISHYRPYCLQSLYYDKLFIERLYQIPKLFPNPELKNMVICVSGIGVNKEFSCLMTDEIPDRQILANAQCFPLYYYEEKEGAREATSSQTRILNEERLPKPKFLKKDGISDYILGRVRGEYRNPDVTKEDIFYYVYGILHNADYRKTFSNDLKKMLPRIPLVDNMADFRSFCEAGRKLADLHLGYEIQPPYSDTKVTGTESKYFRVTKMKFLEKNKKDKIVYNSKITVSEIPERAYQYVVNGRSAIEWIMDQYQISNDADSGITNDPNDWATEAGNPRYILDLLLSVINLSVQTVDIVEGLPKLRFEAPTKLEENSEETNKLFF